MSPQFYQDTLETDGATTKEEEKSDTATSADSKEVKEDGPDSPSTEKGTRVKMEVDGEENEEGSSRDSTKTDMAEDDGSPSQSDSGKPKGVLVIHSQMKRRTKKSVQWRPEEELEMHHYFELDETERGIFLFDCPSSSLVNHSNLLDYLVNVNKLLFGEMKQAEREREKQAFQMSKQMGKSLN